MTAAEQPGLDGLPREVIAALVGLARLACPNRGPVVTAQDVKDRLTFLRWRLERGGCADDRPPC